MTTWLLHLLLDREAREAVLGDLEEGRAAVRLRRGPWHAWWWYQRHAWCSLVSCRITAQRRRADRRYDFDSVASASLRDLLRPALRQFRDHPLYAAACAGTLALAIGAAAVTLAVVKRAFVDPLPYRHGHEIVSLLTVVDGHTSAVSTHVLEDLRAASSPLVEFAPIRPAGLAYTTAASTETIPVSMVTPEYFALLGVAPEIGRIWTPQESDAIVVAAGFWRDQLEQDPDVIGRSLVVDGRSRTIVGVMPAEFVPPYFLTTAVWAPLDVPALLQDIRGRRALTVLARRAPQSNREELDAFLALFSTQLQERFPREHAGQAWIARPLRDEIVGAARPALIGTASAAVLLLLIVAANIAGLSTTHAVAERRQLAVRAALGATRQRLFVEQLVDSLTLALVGSAAGLWLAAGLMQVLTSYQRHFLPMLPPLSLDAGTALVASIAGLGTGVAAALIPRSIVSASPAHALRTARGGSADIRITRTRATLVVAQVAIALMLVVGAGLLVRTVQHLTNRDLGFDSEGLGWIQVTLPGERYQSTDAQLHFERLVVERVRQIPGVRSATASVGFPLWGGMMAVMRIKGEPPGTPGREVAYLSVAPNFTRDVGARIVAGRDLLPTDDGRAPRAVVINEAMAATFWPRGDAIGAEVQIGAGSPTDRWIRVVGIMADMRGHGLTSDIRPTAFGSTLQYSWPRRHIGVRTVVPPPMTLAADLKAAIHGVDPAVAVGAVTTAEQNLSDAMARHRLVMLALGIFGGVALVLCISGLYAVVALNGQQRRREYAIRLALGAPGSDVGMMVVRQALTLAGAGTIVGLLASSVGTRALGGLLHGVEPIDSPTYGLAVGVLVMLALIAAWLPARQAVKVDPVETLRAE